jgi:hypothetical protein
MMASDSIGISAPHRVTPHFEALLPFQVLSRVLPPLWIDRPASTKNDLLPHALENTPQFPRRMRLFGRHLREPPDNTQ